MGDDPLHPPYLMVVPVLILQSCSCLVLVSVLAQSPCTLHRDVLGIHSHMRDLLYLEAAEQVVHSHCTRWPCIHHALFCLLSLFLQLSGDQDRHYPNYNLGGALV